MNRPYAVYAEINHHLRKSGFEIQGISSTIAQLNHCQCWLLEADLLSLDTGELATCKLLQSYSTIVACIAEKTALYGKYSTTTSCQITKAARKWNLDLSNADVYLSDMWLERRQK